MMLVPAAGAWPAASFAEPAGNGAAGEEMPDDEAYDPFAHLGEDGVAPEEAHTYQEQPRLFSVRGVADARYVRVMLPTSHASATVRFQGNYALCDADDQPQFLVNAGTDYTIAVNGSAIEVRTASGTVLYSGAAFYFKEYAPVSASQENYFQINGVVCYQGELNCHHSTQEDETGATATGLFLVNRIYLEDYLKGVLPYEIGDNAGQEALKAQAVVARGYAVKSTRSTGIFDVYSNSQSQVYKGMPATRTAYLSAAAVDATRGLVLKDSVGAIIKTCYSASNGGYTEVATNQWSGSGDYGLAVLKEDPYDLAYSKNPSNTYSGGKPYLEEVTIPASPTNLSAGEQANVDSLKINALLPALQEAGYAGLTADAVTVTAIAMAVNNDCASAECARHHTEPNVCAHFCGLDVTFSGTVLLGGDSVPFSNVTAHIKDTDLYVSGSYGFFSNSQLGKYWLIPQADGLGNVTGYVIRHGRYGHGVGLSQIGAMQMASAEKGYTEILDFYFSGSSLAPYRDDVEPDALGSLPGESACAKKVKALQQDAFVYARLSTDSIKLGLLPAGDQVIVTAANSQYSKIVFGGDFGYVLNSALGTTRAKIKIVNVSTAANVRSGPGGQYEAISSSANPAALGNTYPLIKANYATGWHQIDFNGKTGYIFCQYAKLLNSVEAGAVAAIPYYPIRVTLPSGYQDNTLWVDGVPYAGTVSGGVLTANVYDTAATSAVVYEYDGAIPIGMTVWLLTNTNGLYNANKIDGFNNLLSYHGFSARIVGKSGIRFKSGIAKNTREALLSQGINGYKLVEYGTLAFTNDRYDYRCYPFVITSEFCGHGKSFWTEGGKTYDYVVETVDGRIRFSSVLVGLPDSELATVFPFRAYIKLSNSTKDIIIYGPPMGRSIYTVAKNTMSKNVYAPESSEAAFLNRIITVVESQN